MIDIQEIRSRRIWVLGIAGLAAAAVLGAGGRTLADDPPAGPPDPWALVTIAGSGRPVSEGDGGAAAKASLNNPFGLVRGPDGALYVCEFGGNVIRRIDDAGAITRVAGSGRAGPGGDGGPALEAEFNQPHEIRFDSRGHLYVADMLNHRVRKVDARSQVVTSIAGTGKPGYSGDGGPASLAQLNNPISIQLDRDGNLYICDIGNHRIRRVDAATGVISTVAGTGERKTAPDGAVFAGAPLHGPRTLDFDRDGALWVALREGNQVVRLDFKSGRLSVEAGTGAKGVGGNGGPAREATLSGPKGISIGPDGNVYIADTEGHAIRRIVRSTGAMELVAGDSRAGDGPDGPASKAHLNRPHGVFVDAKGDVYVGDSEAHRVRRVRRTP